MTELLVNFGADLDKRGRNGKSALHYAISCDKDMRLLDFLLRRGADPNIRDFYGKSPVFMADSERLTNLGTLLRYGADPNARDAESQTPLMDCSVEVATVLLTHNADINLRCAKGRNALFYAIIRIDNNLARFLLNNGSKVAADKSGKKMTDLAYEKKISEDIFFEIVKRTPDKDISLELIEKIFKENPSSFIYEFYMCKRERIFEEIDKLGKGEIHTFLIRNICEESRKKEQLENKITELRFYPQ